MANHVMRTNDAFLPWVVTSPNGVVIARCAYETDAALLASPSKDRLKALKMELRKCEKLAPEFIKQVVNEWHGVEIGQVLYAQESTLHPEADTFVVLYREPKFPFVTPVRVVRP